MIKTFVSSFVIGAVVLANGTTASALASSAAAPASSAIPDYLQTGIAKFLSDAGTAHVPQAELMIALVSTGHVGKNLHNHRMQLYQTLIRGNKATIHSAKGKVIRPLDQVFDSVERAHKRVLAQVQNPYPTEMILNGLAEALKLMTVSIDVLDQLSNHPNPVVSAFYQEMKAVLERALGVKEYLKSALPILFTDEGFAEVLKVKGDDAASNAQIVASINEGYSSLLANGATNALLTRTFKRSEFDRVWQK